MTSALTPRELATDMSKQTRSRTRTTCTGFGDGLERTRKLEALVGAVKRESAILGGTVYGKISFYYPCYEALDLVCSTQENEENLTILIGLMDPDPIQG